jgi:hypothetical protein
MSQDGGGAPASDRKPSPSIWKDCPNTLLNDLGLGRYVHEDFYAATPDTIATGVPLPQGQFQLTGDTGGVISGVLPADATGGRVDLQTGTTDNDQITLWQQIGPGLNLNSGTKVWYEARFSVGDVTDDMGVFLGLAEEDFLTDPILDNAATIGAQSAFGFFIASDDPNDLEAIWNLDAGTGTVVLQDITTQTIYTSQSGDDSASLASDTYYRVGLKFDGVDTLRWYLNGFEVASLVLVSGTHPVAVEMGPVVSVKTGDGEAESINVDWIRYAHQEAS